MYHLVIVDDEPKILEGLVHLFPWENLGFEVSGSFSNGREALRFINSHSETDAVMTDIQMPVMTGIELSQNLSDSNIIVIFFSAYQDFEYARAAIINHVVDYLVKPMRYDSLTACFERVRRILDERDPGRTQGAEPGAGLSHQDMIRTVKHYIEQNYQTASLEEAALITHFSPAYLSSTFKTVSGTSFSGYLLKVRMEKALELLAGTDKKLYEIADAVGYVNPKNLTRNFKDYYKVTPQEYRSGRPVAVPTEKETHGDD